MAQSSERLWFRNVFLIVALLYLYSVKDAECLCPSRESEALLKFKGDNPTSALSSWRNGSDCCSGWAGVTCDPAGTHVIALNLTGNLSLAGDGISESLCNIYELEVLRISIGNTPISVTIPSCIWNMTEMRYLTIATMGALLTQGTVSAQVCTLRRLVHLDVAFPLLSSISVPDCLWDMTQLEYLELGDVYVSERFSTGVCNLTNITHLGVAVNNIAVYIPACIWRMARLEYLRLPGFALPSSISPDVCNLANLKYLDLASSYLYGSLPECIWSLRKLEHVDLSEPKTSLVLAFAASITLDICNLKNLTYLSLSSFSPASGQIPICLWNLTRLEVLQIGSLHLRGTFSSQMCNLRQLQILDISYNDFTGALPACFWNMTQLRNADFSGLDLSNMHIPQLVSMSSLVALTLTSTNVNKAFLGKIGNLSALQRLEVSGNGITTFPGVFQGLSQLNYLHASNNLITEIPASIGGLQNLTELDLSYNIIRTLTTASSSIQDPRDGRVLSVLSNLSLLQTIYLSNNLIVEVPPKFFNSSPIGYLDLSDNRLQDFVLPASHSTNLLALFLSNNPLRQVPDGLCRQQQLMFLFLSNISLASSDTGLPPLCLTNISQLIWLDLSSNRISGNLSALITSSFLNLTQMSYLDFSNNNISGDLSVLRLLPALYYLDLSRNELTGAIPKALLSSSLQTSFNLSRNQLSGHIPEPQLDRSALDLSWNNLEGPLPSLAASTFNVLVLSRNNFTGSIPSGLKNSTSFLQALDLSFNNFSGIIPSFLGDMNTLRVLDLTSNRFDGFLPELRDCKILQHLRLKDNNLRGQIPASICEIGRPLLSLTVSSNDLEGPIPSSLGDCLNLQLLDLSHNNLSGILPSSFGGLSGSLRVFTVGSNRLNGSFPAWIVDKSFTYLQVLDLSNNFLHGDLPATFSTLSGFVNGTNASNNDTLYEDGVSVEISAKGQTLKITYFVTLRTSLDVSSNQFSGKVPEQLSELHALRYLTLSGNKFSGSIPTELSNLDKLESLDLSRNSLTGTIPPDLSEIPQLSYFNVSDNFLTGAIPVGGQFNTFSADSFQNNTSLCSISGIPLPPCRTPSAETPTEIPLAVHHRHSWRHELSLWVSLDAFMVGCGTSFGAVSLTFAVSKTARVVLFLPRKKRRVRLDYSKPYGAYMPKS